MLFLLLGIHPSLINVAKISPIKDYCSENLKFRARRVTKTERIT